MENCDPFKLWILIKSYKTTSLFLDHIIDLFFEVQYTTSPQRASRRSPEREAAIAEELKKKGKGKDNGEEE